MIYFLILLVAIFALYQIKVNVILYNDLEVLSTYHFVSLIEAIVIYLKNYTFMHVGIYFSTKRYLDKIKEINK